MCAIAWTLSPPQVDLTADYQQVAKQARVEAAAVDLLVIFLHAAPIWSNAVQGQPSWRLASGSRSKWLARSASASNCSAHGCRPNVLGTRPQHRWFISRS